MMMKKTVTFKCIARRRVDAKCNKLVVGNVFRYPNQVIVVGCEDGGIRVYDLPSNSDHHNDKLKLKSILETKGGPIQSILLHDVTKFGSTDLLVGHSGGMVTVFCNEQIFSRCSITENSVDNLEIDHDATGNLSIVVGDSGGCINAFLPYRPLWRLRLRDHLSIPQSISKSAVVTCLLATNLTNPSGHISNYILACDDNKQLHVIQQGSILLTLHTQSVVTSMCCGQFLPESEAATTPGDKSSPSTTTSSQLASTQIALGGQDGSIYIMSSFQIYSVEYGSVHLPLMQIMSIPSRETVEMDYLLCVGYFNSVMLYHAGKLITKYITSDWVNSMATADVDNDGETEVIISCLDNSIHFLKVA
ncbi:uncharacterized protein LOC100373710 [Saccoglossus kowalevskii]